jgi:hypothetical protein
MKRVDAIVSSESFYSLTAIAKLAVRMRLWSQCFGRVVGEARALAAHERDVAAV